LDDFPAKLTALAQSRQPQGERTAPAEGESHRPDFKPVAIIHPESLLGRVAVFR